MLNLLVSDWLTPSTPKLYVPGAIPGSTATVRALVALPVAGGVSGSGL